MADCKGGLKKLQNSFQSVWQTGKKGFSLHPLWTKSGGVINRKTVYLHKVERENKGLENKMKNLWKRFGSLKTSVTFAPASNGKLFKTNGKVKAYPVGFEKENKGLEKEIKKLSKGLGKLKTSITFAAAKTKSETFWEAYWERKRQGGKKIKKIKKTLAGEKKAITFAAPDHRPGKGGKKKGNEREEVLFKE